MASITIEHVTKAFGDVVVLKDFHETIQDKEFVTLLGPSGCGKTTMLRMIAGFEKPTSGLIKIGDRVVSGNGTFVPPEKRGIGMVFQSYAVWPHMNVFDNVAYPLKIAKRPKDEIKKKVERVLETVHLSQYAQRFPMQLSGGQQQRVALARALVAEPSVLLLDEPLSNLDAKLRESMRFEIKQIQREYGITVVYVTHDQTEAMAMSDRIVVINRGVVQQVGSPTEVYRRPANQFVADFVGTINFLKGEAKGGRIELQGLSQSIPYDGMYKGKVVVAIRPENVSLLPNGGQPLNGRLTNTFYLGDITDCRVDVGGQHLRVIANSRSYDTLTEGQEVTVYVDDFLVYEDDGRDDHTQIVT
ncbi:MAG TPA: ABC transporter ATP-binding protein [Limnochordia bacterium]|jgi:iron(III) transport system ATP-binding protein|nr:ABC transporter ATP-binding protein [Bacillota bacterium]HOK32765.1 ABC transporter ATP-binding protein [Limnochordia bacterium]HPU66231.1 ABC transporter ATP-binding protein [Limnochordia bacterium]HPZ14467.1 ABC transporter ATP-binding protein [Bacillota bacterium]